MRKRSLKGAESVDVQPWLSKTTLALFVRAWGRGEEGEVVGGTLRVGRSVVTRERRGERGEGVEEIGGVCSTVLGCCFAVQGEASETNKRRLLSILPRPRPQRSLTARGSVGAAKTVYSAHSLHLSAPCRASRRPPPRHQPPSLVGAGEL